ncbi:peptidase C15 [Salinarimonas sp.]|uniref:pyroglutamyl-peptidase I family protein n=1 Tax=Salinarimonas sp. TaxID=2766526 RepID=UPI0032D981A6
MIRLLITGFGPFPGVPRNPTAALAQSLAADPRWRRLGVEARALVLETSYGAIEGALLPALRDVRPDAVLMLGVAARRRAICLETRAVNRATRRLPDASGRLPTRLAWKAGAPFVRPARAPVPVLAAALRAGAPGATRVSRDAGRYLCNVSYFDALAEPHPAGLVFVHVPMPRTGSGRPLDRGAPGRLAMARMRRALMSAALALTRVSRRSPLRPMDG